MLARWLSPEIGYVAWETEVSRDWICRMGEVSRQRGIQRVVGRNTFLAATLKHHVVPSAHAIQRRVVQLNHELGIECVLDVSAKGRGAVVGAAARGILARVSGARLQYRDHY